MMMIHARRFNLYLIGALSFLMACGCSSPKQKEKQTPAKMDLHLEVSRDSTNLSEPVPIFREKPVMVNVEKESVISELNVKEVKVVDVVGGFALQIKFDRQGTWLLEEITTQNHGKRLAVHCDFGPEMKESRWLGAPMISKGISDGNLLFTPDATREECETIALELNNVAREVQKNADE